MNADHSLRVYAHAMRDAAKSVSEAEVSALWTMNLAQDVVLTRLLAYLERAIPGSLETFTDDADEYRSPATEPFINGVNHELRRMRLRSRTLYAAATGGLESQDASCNETTAP